MVRKMVHLEKISWENYVDVLKLHVSKEQEDFVANNDVSLIHAFLAVSEENPVFAFAINDDETVVGFILLGYDDDWTGYDHEEWLKSDVYKAWEGKKYYYVWRFMIDEKYQKKGYGRKALELALDFIKTEPCGKAEYVTLSYERTNTVAKKLYSSFGFYEPEEFAPYYEEDDEITAILKL